MSMRNLIRIIILAAISLFGLSMYGQCYKGDQKQQKPPTELRDPGSGTSATLPIQRSSDPNEIIGTRGYDNLGDTMQWVAATASLPYTIYFENDPELATAAAQKVENHNVCHVLQNRNTLKTTLNYE